MTHTVSFVGLGAMGLNSARLLAAAPDIALRAFDLRAEALSALEAAGGTPCASAAQANQDAGYAVVFVVNGRQAEEVIFGAGGLHETARPGLVIISCVTMLPDEAAAIGRRCRERGWHFIDAPVSGGMVGAAAGTLTVMAAGERGVIDACRFIFDRICKRLMVVGDQAGQGSMVKAINQLLCGVHLAAAGEAMALAERAGLDKQAVLDGWGRARPPHGCSTTAGRAWRRAISARSPAPWTSSSRTLASSMTWRARCASRRRCRRRRCRASSGSRAWAWASWTTRR
ncbi:NAD(P)-dependent oxidoreductase [Herbaspirillum robiniae]|uniref:NAD(P)-dependent oxidoreductase n=1 Tax=Herbaspirillum robiniae TaxID=2014887 RepID=A0ABX2LUV1_9BURK|nr:NAD(P)-dependent oxidoreductase [Herbaspirillum robiniae]NUU02302.1 NAD(P)-dependent oxidoreductase [Herbaspirillum robiniae]